MNLVVNHLIVGSGIFGLALADQLLRRGESGVLIVSEGDLSSTVRQSIPLCVQSEDSEYSSVEKRGFELLEYWPSFMEADPKLRTSGSTSVLTCTCGDSGSRVNSLSSEQHFSKIESDQLSLCCSLLSERQSSLSEPPEQDDDPGKSFYFSEKDSVIELSQLVSSLNRSIRSRGGRIKHDFSIDSIQSTESGVTFGSGGQKGIAQKVYFCDGQSVQPLARALKIPLGYEPIIVQEVELAGEPVDFQLLRFWECQSCAEGMASESLGAVLEDGDGLLELDSLESSGSTPGGSDEKVLCRQNSVLLADEQGCWKFFHVREAAFDEEAVVCWNVWQQFVQETSGWLPKLSSARVRHARAMLSSRQKPGSSLFEHHHDRRVWTTSPLGPYSLLIELGLAEEIACAALDTP